METSGSTGLVCSAAGEAGTHAQAASMPSLVLCHLIGNRWPRPDERHIAAQDIPELRDFVEAPLAQPAANRRYARVVADLEGGAVKFIACVQVLAHFVGAVDH